MIILGDIAVPSLDYSDQLKRILQNHADIFSNENLAVNLEGLVNDEAKTTHKTPNLFNHSSVVDVLDDWNTKFVGLANNHTLDFPDSLTETTTKLKKHNIGFSGAGFSEKEADTPAIIDVNGKTVVIFNHCWRVMLQHQKNPSNGVHVSIISEKKILKNVKKYREKYPDAAILVYLHWNFDLETLPFPQHRQFSKALIDYGVNVVVGCHSHCVQGGESYKNGYIVYGLGNFFVPWKTFINGTIHFPDFARIEMAFEWDPISNDAICHFFRYENEGDIHKLTHLESDTFENNEMLKFYSPYQGMNEVDYLSWFKRNRRKKGGLPVYKDYEATIRNNMKDWFIMKRIKLARVLAKYKIREWNH